MKKETIFILAMFVAGPLAGLAITLALMLIAVPQFTQYQLTLAEKADWERIASYGNLMTGSLSWVLLAAVSLAIATIVLFLFLRVLNPQSMAALKKWRSVAGAKLLIVFLFSLAWLYVLANTSGSLYMMQKDISRSIQFGMYLIGTAGLWLIAGEQGWAGNFSSWRMPLDAKPVRVLFLGATAGVVIFAVVYFFDLAAGKYFILVSEVLDESGETSFLGFKYLALGWSIQITLELALVAGFVAALAPVHREAAEIRQRLVKPTVALVVTVALLFTAYSYAGKNYDLDKPDLAAAVGVAGSAGSSKTVLIFNPSKDLPVTVQEWPLKTTAWSMAAGGTIELTKDNLRQVEAYLNAHRGGTIYTNAARSTLMTGYYALWEVQEGLAWQVKAAESQLLPRFQLLARFSSMRVTPENLQLLESYSDEGKWHHSAKSARSISMAYHHFGDPAKAGAWLQKAKKSGAEITDANYLDIPAVTQGTLKGRILLNEKPLSDVKVGLLSHQTPSTRVESYTLKDFSLASSLQDAVRTASDGSFAFTRLGNGKYLIAIMTEKSAIPFDVKPGQIKVSNVPGLVQIGPGVIQDLGIIKIVVDRK